MRARVYASALLLTWSGAIILAQTPQKITTPEQLDKVMKAVQQANQPVGKAMASGAYADVRKGLAAVKENVLLSQSFWIEHKKDDAVQLNKETLAKIEAVEKLIATDTVDAAAATTALKEVGASCRACHMKYRATDADNNFILKPGTLEGK
jgi:cytochrome c556